ncbi:hypothetical protein [Roseateles albus]|uniref:Uncharacterized protein n=1 Tax=Roseateles albus TaxID=2987525 RepID=A0ABT5K9M0_9BURK|nr:hypothetical protein [Roseateles albus]MDC8770649.1 hypothetical protein [Roseateles albus]
MKSVFKLPEALVWLSDKTGREWSDSELFEVVCKLHLTLRAAPPRDAKTKVHECVNGEGVIEKDFGIGYFPSMGWRMAVVHPSDVQILWMTGEAETQSAVNDSGVNGPTEELLKQGADFVGSQIERWFFTKPVRVTRDTVYATKWTLEQILEYHCDTAPESQPPEVDADLPMKSAPAKREPVLGSGAMRAVFGHLPGVPKQGFSDVPKWLGKPHILVARREAPIEHEWNPVAFAKMMMNERGITYQTLNNLFLYQAVLKPFLRTWQEANREPNAFGM